MAIPISDMKKTIQSPEVARGTTDDFSREIYETYKPAKEALNLMGSSVDLFVKIRKGQEMQNDQLAANNATNEYFATTEKLNQELATKQGINAEQFKATYYAKAQEAHNKFLNAISQIKDGNIRESARKQINNYNLSFANKSSSYFFDQDQKVKDAAAESSLANQKNLFINNLTGDAGRDYLNYQMSAAKASNDIIQNLTLKGMPNEYIYEATRNYKSALYAAMVDRAAEMGHGSTPYRPYSGAFALLDKAQDSDLDANVKKDLYRKYEKQQLAWIAQSNIQELVKDGELDREKIHRFSPHLTQEEREITLKDTKSANNGNQMSLEEVEVAAALKDRIQKDLAAYYQSIGNVTLAKLRFQYPELDDEELGEKQKELLSNASVIDILNMMTSVKNLTTEAVAVRRGADGSLNYEVIKGSEKGNLTQEQRAKYEANGYTILTSPVGGEEGGWVYKTQQELYSLALAKIRSADFPETKAKFWTAAKPATDEALVATLVEKYQEFAEGPSFLGIHYGEKPETDYASLVDVVGDFLRRINSTNFASKACTDLTRAEKDEAAYLISEAINSAPAAWKESFVPFLGDSPSQNLTQGDIGFGQQILSELDRKIATQNTTRYGGRHYYTPGLSVIPPYRKNR